MAITTTDCKEFLATQLNLDAKGFKRLRKFKDGRTVVREFSHMNSSATITIFENNGQLTLTPPIPSQHSAISDLAGEYVFSLIDEDHQERGEHTVLMTRRSYWQYYGSMNDQSDYEPHEFLPSEWMATDVNDAGTWEIVTTDTADEIIAKLHDLGCHSDARFDQLCGGRSALNCPLLENRKFKEVLTQAVANSNPPNQGLSKI